MKMEVTIRFKDLGFGSLDFCVRNGAAPQDLLHQWSGAHSDGNTRMPP